jgi:hypothetical protein
LLDAIRHAVDAGTIAALQDEASQELEPFRAAMHAAAYERAHAAAVGRLLRLRFKLPIIAFE